jgi:hypothetical protein
MANYVAANVIWTGGCVDRITNYPAYDESHNNVLVQTKERLMNTAQKALLDKPNELLALPDIDASSSDGDDHEELFSERKARVVLTDSKTAILCQLCDGRSLHIVFETPCNLMSPDRGTGETYHEISKRLEMKLDIPPALIGRRERIPTTDGEGAIARQERYRDANTGEIVDPRKCKIHKTTKLIKYSVEATQKDDVVGVDNLLSALRTPGTMRRARNILRGLLFKHHDFQVGSPGIYADEHRKGLFDKTFPIVDGNASSKYDRWALERAVTGNCMTELVFDVYVPPGEKKRKL